MPSVLNDFDVHASLNDVLRRVIAGDPDWTSFAYAGRTAEHPELLRGYLKDELRQAAIQSVTAPPTLRTKKVANQPKLAGAVVRL